MKTTKKELELALLAACDFVYSVSGTCPWDQFDKQPVKCEKKCRENVAAKCFAIHFINEIKGKKK